MSVMYLKDKDFSMPKKTKSYHLFEDYSDIMNRLNLDPCRKSITYIFMKKILKSKYYPSYELERLKTRKDQKLEIIACMTEYLRQILKDEKTQKNITRWSNQQKSLIHFNWLL